MGRRGLAAGTAELRDRATGVVTVVPLAQVVTEVASRITALRAALDEPVNVDLPAELFTD